MVGIRYGTFSAKVPPQLCQEFTNIYIIDLEATAYCTANPTWGDIFESSFKAQRSKLEFLFSPKRGKRNARALSFDF